MQKSILTGSLKGKVLLKTIPILLLVLALILGLALASVMNTSAPALAKTPLTSVSISGSTMVGSSLTATVLPSGAHASYQWQKCSTPSGTYTSISGATSSSYTLQSSDLDKYIEVVATGSGSYTGKVTSLYVGPVTTPTPTTTTVTSSKNPSNYGDSVYFTATVSPSAASGTVQFKIDGSNFGSPVTLSGSSASSASTTTLSVGSHTITAIYSGDANYNTSTGTLSSGQTVNPAATSTTVISSKNPSNYGDSVYFTATVSPSTASGTVQFKIDGSNFGSPVTLSGSSASSASTTTLSVGSHTITAVYSGDSNYNTSTGTLSGGQTVNQSPQTITFNTLPTKTYGDADFAPDATASSRLTVSYNSSNTSVATIVSGNIHIIAQAHRQ